MSDANGETPAPVSPIENPTYKRWKWVTAGLANVFKITDEAHTSDRISRDPLAVLSDVQRMLEATEETIRHDGQIPHDWESETGSKILCGEDLLEYLDKPTDYLIGPWIVRGGISQLQGDPKAGKSVFALYLSIAASLGHADSFLEIPQPLNVLYIHYEDATTLVAKRVDQYMRGLGNKPGTMPTNLFLCYFPRLNLDSLTTQKMIKAKVAELKADVLVLDTLSYVHGAEENSATEMRPIMYALKELAFEAQIGILYLHHTAKGSDERAMVQRGRGSSVITAAADVVIHWGDRKGTNTTPVSIQSKFESAIELSIDYIPKAPEKDAPADRMPPVEWAFRTAEDAESPLERAKLLIPMVGEFQKTAPDGINSTQLMLLSKLKPRTFYKYVKMCVELELLKEVKSGKSKLYLLADQKPPPKK